MNQIAITVTYPHPPPDLKKLESVCQRILALQGKDNWELSVLCTDDATIRKLNSKYRGIDKATDVLSFSQFEGQELPVHEPERYIAAGDIVISVDTLLNNSRHGGNTFQDELMRVLVHGILHLAGLEHNENDAQDIMITLQESILAQLRKEKMF
ncbi:MAG: rRNA maturation RNase YbeY [Spirochaetales bacterium]|nr:rRNA maturation RNase YbeY [Spirochaetales bacterium]